MEKQLCAPSVVLIRLLVQLQVIQSLSLSSRRCSSVGFERLKMAGETWLTPAQQGAAPDALQPSLRFGFRAPVSLVVRRTQISVWGIL